MQQYFIIPRKNGKKVSTDVGKVDHFVLLPPLEILSTVYIEE